MSDSMNAKEVARQKIINKMKVKEPDAEGRKVKAKRRRRVKSDSAAEGQNRRRRQSECQNNRNQHVKPPLPRRQSYPPTYSNSGNQPSSSASSTFVAKAVATSVQATVATSSHVNLTVQETKADVMLDIAIQPGRPANFRQPAGKRTYLLKNKHVDPNKVGWDPRPHHRHSHQARRQAKFLSYMYGTPLNELYSSDDEY